MQSKWMRRIGLVAIVGVTAASSVGCADERDPINKVQPNYTQKSFYVGSDLASSADDPEFYMRNTVVDVPYGAGADGLFTATYAQPVNRMKWEITEGSLIGRSTHERIANTDGHGSKRTNDGQVVAMFKITKHFDIRRDYNAQTGEENNIVVENDTDRPWNERQYMRVDWSQNLVTDGYGVDTGSMLGMTGSIKWSPLSYFVNDPNDPDAPHFSPEEGYFDITTKVYASPQKREVDFGDGEKQSYPLCFFLGHHPVTNCNATEVTLRLAFRKVVDTDFEATEWNGQKMDAFGVFTEDRFGYDRNYQVTDERWHRFQAKWNTWQKSHVEGSQCAVDQWRDEDGKVARYKVDASGNYVTDGVTGLPIPDAAGQPYPPTPAYGRSVHADADKDGTEDACTFRNVKGEQVHVGSRCDEFARKCTLPTYERKIKTTPWYYGPESPPDLFTSTAEALNQWNDAVRYALQVRMKIDADKAGFDSSGFLADEAAIHEDKEGKLAPHVFVLCHNPVAKGDNAVCGPEGLRARVGDLRYSMINLLQNPQTPSPWGIMVDAVDPLTGEKIAGSANEWVHVLDIAGQSTLDLMKWFNGEITDNAIMSGEYLKDWVRSSKLGAAEHQPKLLDPKEIDDRIKSLDLAMVAPKNVPVKADIAELTPAQARSATESLARRTGPTLDTQFEATRHALIGSPIETMLVSPDMLQAAGYDPKTLVTADANALQAASPLRGQSQQFRRYLQHMKDTALERQGACMIEQPEPNSVAGLARMANRLFPPPAKDDPEYAFKNHDRDAKVHQWLRSNMHLGVIAHELGHSMGLRHNFTGTWDSLNYPKEYWQLRTQNGKEKSCRGLDGQNLGRVQHFQQAKANNMELGAVCVGPRWVDPLTEQEVDGMVWKWGTSTVMDYPGDVSQDFNGLGPYDKAAARFFYGELVDVDAPSTKIINALKNDDYLSYLSSTAFNYWTGKHYSEFNDAYNLVGNCEGGSPGDPLSAKCSGTKLDHVLLSDMTDFAGDARRAPKPFAVAPDKRTRHPYMFSSDEYAAPSNVTNNRFDSGADPYEKVQFLVTAYENRYIFDYFRRDRVQFTTDGVVARSADRYFDMIAGVTKTLGLYSQIYGELFGRDTVSELVSGVDYFLPLAIASADGFALFTRIMTRPEPGEYVTEDRGGQRYARVREAQDRMKPEFRIAAGSGEGRYINNDYDFDKGGYFWSDYQTRVGTTYEKSQAMEYLLEAYNRFVQVDRRDFVDGRWKNINYATLYPEQMRRLFASLMQSDPMTVGPYVVNATGGAAETTVGRVQFPSWDKAGELTYPPNAVTLDPVFGWEQQFRSLVNAFMYAPTTLTMDWYDQMRVFVKGGNDDVNVRGTVLEFEDPESRIVYMARDYGGEQVHGRLVNRGAGARMIEFANALAREAFLTDGDTVLRNAEGQPMVRDQPKVVALRRYIANLAVVRQLTDEFGAGPLDRRH